MGLMVRCLPLLSTVLGPLLLLMLNLLSHVGLGCFVWER
jgi:hypothetical protein